VFKFLHLIAAGLLCVASGFCQSFENVIIKVNQPYDKVITAIEARGGKITHRFKHTGALAAQLPAGAMADVGALNDVIALRKDTMVHVGSVRNGLAGERLSQDILPQAAIDGFQTLSESDIRSLSGPITRRLKSPSSQPAGYKIDNTLMGLDTLFASGQQGKGIVVAVIDRGIRPNYPHIAGSVIGGENLVNDGLGYVNDQEEGHATFVAGMIASHVSFIASNTSPLVQALNAYAPGAVKPYDDTRSSIAMVGTAPGASLYILRVFPIDGLAPYSLIMAAMERVIELRELYDAGAPGGVNIKVCNMSIGGSTLNAGNDPEDELVDAMLAHDIVPVIAAANSGPAPITVGSLGTSRSALTVGGASLDYNERIATEVSLGPGTGALYRPYATTLMYFASGRGPDANGRIHPHVVASAHYNWGMGFSDNRTTGFSSGTSFASPCVAGVAAVLRQAYPGATARQIRNAIIASANPNIVAEADVLDQGHGFVDAEAAGELLAAGLAPDTVDPLPDVSESVQTNVERNTSLKAVSGYVRQPVSAKPGERREILYRVESNTLQVIVTVANFSALPPEQQNRLQGDNFSFGIHSAKTSSIGSGGDYVAELHTLQTGTKVINNPEPGIMRIVLNGNTHNVGEVSADVVVFSLTSVPPQLTSWAQIGVGKSVMIPFNISAGTNQAKFRLSWKGDWSKIPTSDLDLLLLSPTSKLNTDGWTQNSPELVSIDHPEAGSWLAIINGFDVPAGTETYEFTIELDGKVIR
jgi:subtilisin family serine protease